MNAHALVVTAPCEMEVQPFELPAMKSDDVLIRTEYSGVSQGTEIYAYRGVYPGLSFPTVTGYQSVGVIEAVGDSVKNLAVGDRVLFTTCRLPESFPFTWMAGHVSHAVASTSSRAPLKLPDGIDPVEAALTAMVAVSLGGIQQIRVELGDVVLVSGQGLIGQAAAQLARSRGAVVVTTDLSPMRVELSRAHSADIALNPSTDDVDAVLRELAPVGVDVVIETSGRSDLFSTCVDRIRTQGTILLQGYYKQHFDIDFHPTHIKKPTIAAACGFGDMRLALSLLRWGKASMAPLINHRVSPLEAPAMFAKMEAADPDILGVVFDWSQLGA